MKTIWITGGNRGIGLELAKHYISDGHHVIVLCRQSSEALSKTAAQIIEGIELMDPTSLSPAIELAHSTPIDILINNAGILRSESLDHLDNQAFESIDQQIKINAIAPLRVTSQLRHGLKKGSKVVLMTSRMGSIEDNTSGGRYGYRMSKAALNAAGKSLAHDLYDDQIPVTIIHPGWVKTDMTGQTGHITPDESAAQIIQRIDEASLETSGTFLHANGSPLPW